MAGTSQRMLARLYADADTPMFVVTAAAAGEVSGCLVGFATQASIDPPRFLACISRKNHTYKVAVRTETLVVHLLHPDAHDLAELFGGETGDEVDKLAQVAWRKGPYGTPVLERLPNWFAGRVVERVPFGDHDGFLLEPFAGSAEPGADALHFRAARDIVPGHAP